MKNLFSLLLTATVLSFVVSCGGEDAEVFTIPTVSTTINGGELTAGDAGSASFTVSVDTDLTATWSAVATGSVTLTTTSGTVSGTTVDVPFTSTNVPGAASVTLTVTDSKGQTANATVVYTVVEEQTVFRITSNITSNTTWEAGKTYILGGRIKVLNGATLTIGAGAVVKGEAGAGTSATALLVARGGKLEANGTATAPIIFTSIADEITPADIAAGNFASPNLAPDVAGLWGGVIVLGKAQISASNADGQRSEVQIEGIPTSDTDGLYGGTENADNSGSINYISIRHGGTNIGAGNEINGLTLGGVGSGTTINNVEIVGNQDDGIEFFGGAVSVTNAVVWNVGDDAIDTDQSWSGTLDNFVVIAPNTAGAHCFELDGPEGTYSAGHTIKKGTVLASAGSRLAENLIDVDANSIVTLEDIFITEIKAGQDINRTTAVGVVFTRIELNVPAADLQNYVTGTIPAGVTAASTPSTGVGANLTVFGWSWAGTAEGVFPTF